MGGYGSGGHNMRKSSTGYCPRIDSFWFNNIIPTMNEKNIEQKAKNITWDNGAKINLIVYQSKIAVDYRFQLNDYDEWKNVREDIRLSELPNNYGGNRLYFTCPTCWGRYRFLYVRSGYFRCRRCNKLNYPSSRKGKNDVMTIKMNNLLRDKFKVDTKELSYCDMSDYVPDKPKGMHWKTYYKWLDKLEEAQEEYDTMFMRKVYSFGARYL